MSVALLWFRQDLRCHDNPALVKVCANHQQIIPLYIKEPNPSVPMGGAQQWWLHHSLSALKISLRTVNLDLYLRTAEPLQLLKQLIVSHKIEAVYWNRCYEPAHRHRDQYIKTELKALGVEVISCNGSLLHEPWDILNKAGEYYKVFTPYWQQCLRQMHPRLVEDVSHWPALCPIVEETLDDWGLLPKHPDWAIHFAQHWQPGETGAWQKLEQFAEEHLNDYKELRNHPSIDSTSRLSPHLHFGEISPQQIWQVIKQKMAEPDCNLASAHHFLSELGWREFSYYLLYHVPSLPERNFKPLFDAFPWSTNLNLLSLWQKGLTGYPIVDAGMRELWSTGYMHNRVRMIVASFLTKDLLIDWRQGAAWFWDTLLDADLANNSASWQWVAGSGADTAPYYRIFNPVLQGEKFDPQGEYIKRWIPQLATVPTQWIHKPWKMPSDLRLDINYPPPIVDHSTARQQALASYNYLK